MNPYFIVHGVHKNILTGELEVNYEIIVTRENGSSHEKGTALIGQKIEVEIKQHEDTSTTN